MVTNRQQAMPPSSRKGPMGRRRRPGREPAYVWWIAFAVLGVLALLAGSWRGLLLVLALWCCYEYVLVPLECRARPNGAQACPEPVRGRAFGCCTAHQQIKNDALWRTVGLGGSPRSKPPEADPNRDTGLLVWYPRKRGSMDPSDRVILIVATACTIAVIAGTAFGFTYR
jgi:hypothetical protein